MRFGIIGTNFITDWFIKSGRICDDFELTAVYSRSLDRAREYAQKNGIAHSYDNLGEFSKCPFVDAVYIASPNYMHSPQAIQMLKSGKHVLCEKPMASNSAELDLMLQTAKNNGVVLLEAIRNILSPSFEIIKKHLPELGKLRRVSLVYNQYSSRYDKFKSGIVENAFNPELSNGALMDIGVYCVQMMVALFGKPETVLAKAVKLSNGLDGQGFILAGYDGMLAELSYSKISQSVLPSVIQGEDGSLLIDHMVTPRNLKLQLRNGEEREIICEEAENNMTHEIQKFMSFAKTGQGAEFYNACSIDAMRIMDDVRCQQGILFPADTSIF